MKEARDRVRGTEYRDLLELHHAEALVGVERTLLEESDHSVYHHHQSSLPHIHLLPYEGELAVVILRAVVLMFEDVEHDIVALDGGWVLGVHVEEVDEAQVVAFTRVELQEVRVQEDSHQSAGTPPLRLDFRDCGSELNLLELGQGLALQSHEAKAAPIKEMKTPRAPQWIHGVVLLMGRKTDEAALVGEHIHPHCILLPPEKYLFLTNELPVEKFAICKLYLEQREPLLQGSRVRVELVVIAGLNDIDLARLRDHKQLRSRGVPAQTHCVFLLEGKDPVEAEWVCLGDLGVPLKRPHPHPLRGSLSRCYKCEEACTRVAFDLLDSELAVVDEDIVKPEVFLLSFLLMRGESTAFFLSLRICISAVKAWSVKLFENSLHVTLSSVRGVSAGLCFIKSST